jgi:hypothetical protein
MRLLRWLGSEERFNQQRRRRRWWSASGGALNGDGETGEPPARGPTTVYCE